MISWKRKNLEQLYRVYKKKDGCLEINSRPSRFSAEICIGGKSDFCMVTRLDGKDMPAKKYSDVEILILCGELFLDVIKPKEKIKIMYGEMLLATGIIEEVSEIYVEKKIVEFLKSKPNFKEELKKIIDLTSNLDNAIIEEGVVEMLDE